MSDSMLEAAYQLTRAGKPFVLATVVWRERPTSARPGAQAVIQEDGELRGWIGGSCTQPIVVREARRLLRERGEPFLLRLLQYPQNEAQKEPYYEKARASRGSREDSVQARETGGSVALMRRESEGVRVYPMTCASGGALDIYLEPHLPKPQLLLVGDSPVHVALQQLAPILDFNVTQVDDANLSEANIDQDTFIIIATHGQYDENILERTLVSSAAYIGMVSSKRRAEACRAYLRESGLSEEHIARLRAPVGLNIGARTPAEIAVSILAELTGLRRRPVAREAEVHEDNTGAGEVAPSAPILQPEAATAIDPVCSMQVEIAGARHTSVHGGNTYYFCCPACKRQFEREPERFLVGT